MTFYAHRTGHHTDAPHSTRWTIRIGEVVAPLWGAAGPQFVGTPYTFEMAIPTGIAMGVGGAGEGTGPWPINPGLSMTGWANMMIGVWRIPDGPEKTALLAYAATVDAAIPV